MTDDGGIRQTKEGDSLQVASWYQTCFEAGLPVTIQVNERYHIQGMRTEE
jgi:hypothetical protein